MDCMVLSRKYIYRTYEFLSSGTESDFFRMDKEVGIKVFKDLDRVKETLPNKLKKIERTVGIERSGIKYPRMPILDENGDLLAYTVNIFETANKYEMMEPENFVDLKRPFFSLFQKICFYQKLESLVQFVHNDSMRLVDTNPENFLIGAGGSVALIDTDNYMHPDYPCDNIPSYLAKYYIDKTGDELLTFVDEFSLAIRFLELVINGFYRSALISILSGELFYVDMVIEDLDIPNELKNILLATVSADGKKEFIGPYLDCIIDSDQRYLRRKNSSLH